MSCEAPNAFSLVDQADSKTNALLADSSTLKLRRAKITRRQAGPKDVAIRITHAGICHSDVHQLLDDWKNAAYPMVPGHEIFGVVTEVGDEVSKFAVGQRVGVGCMVESCRSCKACKMHQEQFCPGTVFTFNSVLKDGTATFGGYSDAIVVDEHFVCLVPDAIPDEVAAPLLCAGITTYSPLARFGIIGNGEGKRVGVAGLGGLGHMAVKLIKAAGAEPVVLSRSDAKRARAEELGASYVDYSDPVQMQAAADSLDVVLDTIAANHDVNIFFPLLIPEGTIVMLAVQEKDMVVKAHLVFRGINLAGSLIGGMKETQEMLDFCAEHAAFPDVEMIPASYVGQALTNLATGRQAPKDGGRYVIDVQGTLVDGDWEMDTVEE